MGAWHLMRGWADTSTVIARCFPARGGGAIRTSAQSLTGAKEPREGGGAIAARAWGHGGAREGRSIAGRRAALCQGGGGGRGRRNAHILITLRVSGADTW